MADGLSQPNKISGERLERDVAMAEGLTQTNKIASKSWRELERDQRDMELWPMAYHSLTRQLERARERLERDGAMANGLSQPNKISGERLERDVAMADGLTQTNKIASKSWRELERDQREMELWLMAYHSLRRQLERAIRRERAREEIQSYLDKLMSNGQTDLQSYFLSCYRD